MNEITCNKCNVHLGYATDCGPETMYYCESCKNEEDREDENQMSFCLGDDNE